MSGSEMLRKWMAERGVRQAEVARLIGVHRSTVSNYLAETRRPDRRQAEALRKLAKIPVGAWEEEE